MYLFYDLICPAAPLEPKEHMDLTAPLCPDKSALISVWNLKHRNMLARHPRHAIGCWSISDQMYSSNEHTGWQYSCYRKHSVNSWRFRTHSPCWLRPAAYLATVCCASSSACVGAIGLLRSCPRSCRTSASSCSSRSPEPSSSKIENTRFANLFFLHSRKSKNSVIEISPDPSESILPNASKSCSTLCGGSLSLDNRPT